MSETINHLQLENTKEFFGGWNNNVFTDIVLTKNKEEAYPIRNSKYAQRLIRSLKDATQKSFKLV